MSIKIVVSGPGLTIDPETFIIKHALERYGFKNISVKDKDGTFIAFCQNNKIEELLFNTDETIQIEIEVNNLPWGG